MNLRRAASVTAAAMWIAVALPLAAHAEAPPAPAAAPAESALSLSAHGAAGQPLFTTVGSSLQLRGVVTPYVPAQTVEASVYLDGRKIATQTLAVAPAAGRTGTFTFAYSSAAAGRLQVRIVHYATPTQGAFTASSKPVQVVHVDLGPGSRGASVRLLQEELSKLHYAIPVNGVFDEATGDALIAFRKMTGLQRIPTAGRAVFAALRRGEGAFRVRYRYEGRHVEANLTKQVLAEIEPGGRVHLIYMMSSGKPSTPTVIGRFRVYSKTPGINSEGMVDSNYFIRGYAIHGYAEVPTYAASHGCLRVPIPDAPAIYAWLRYGTPVDVYNELGGGSSVVRSDAGP